VRCTGEVALAELSDLHLPQRALTCSLILSCG